MMETRLLINGALVGGEGAAESILDPASGAQIAQVPEASRGQVDAAVAAGYLLRRDADVMVAQAEAAPIP